MFGLSRGHVYATNFMKLISYERACRGVNDGLAEWANAHSGFGRIECGGGDSSRKVHIF